MRGHNRLPFNLPPKQMAIVVAFVLVYDLLMTYIGYGSYSLIGSAGLFILGGFIAHGQQHRATIKHNWNLIKQFWRGGDDTS